VWFALVVAAVEVMAMHEVQAVLVET